MTFTKQGLDFVQDVLSQSVALKEAARLAEQDDNCDTVGQLSSGIRMSILTRKSSFQQSSPSNSRRGSIRKTETLNPCNFSRLKKSKFAVNLQPVETEEDNLDQSAQRIFLDHSQDSHERDYLIRQSLEKMSGKPAPRKVLQLSHKRLMSNRFDEEFCSNTPGQNYKSNISQPFPGIKLSKLSQNQGYLNMSSKPL